MVDKIILWHLFKFRQVPLYCIKKWDLSQAEGAEESLLGVGPGNWRLLQLPQTPPSPGPCYPRKPCPSSASSPGPHAPALCALFQMVLHQLAEGREIWGAKMAMDWSCTLSPSSLKKPHTGVMPGPGDGPWTENGLPRKEVKEPCPKRGTPARDFNWILHWHHPRLPWILSNSK